MSGNQQNLCFSVTIHKLTGYLRFTVYPQQLRHLGYITTAQYMWVRTDNLSLWKDNCKQCNTWRELYALSRCINWQKKQVQEGVLLRVWCQLWQSLKNTAFVFSLTESCRLNGINPETYLEKLFKCIVNKGTYDKRQLLPCYIKI